MSLQDSPIYQRIVASSQAPASHKQSLTRKIATTTPMRIVDGFVITDPTQPQRDWTWGELLATFIPRANEQSTASVQLREASLTAIRSLLRGDYLAGMKVKASIGAQAGRGAAVEVVVPVVLRAADNNLTVLLKRDPTLPSRLKHLLRIDEINWGAEIRDISTIQRT